MINKRFKRRSIAAGNSIRRNARILSAILFFLPVLLAFRSPPQDKIQQVVAGIKEAYYSRDEDYHTDGQRTVWVKYYRNWTPKDLAVLKKEAPEVLKFFGQAIAHKRTDVLEQLLPNYYRLHGGIQAFSADIKQILGK